MHGSPADNMFPNAPTPGQRFVDHNSNVWLFNGVSWSSAGVDVTIPVADDDSGGLVSQQLKDVITTYSQYHGGFGIIINPLASADVISGDIVLKSASLDITCNQDTIEVKIAQRTLDGIIWEVCGRDGPTGDAGVAGRKGLTGLGDGPQGYPGVDGLDNPNPIPLDFIESIDSSELTSTGIIDVIIDNGVLIVCQCNLAVPDADATADQMVALPVVKNYSITDGFSSVAFTGDDLMLCLGGNGQILPVQLSGFLEVMRVKYRAELESVDAKYALEVKSVLTQADADSRKILNELNAELLQCEMKLQANILTTFGPCEVIDPLLTESGFPIRPEYGDNPLFPEDAGDVSPGSDPLTPSSDPSGPDSSDPSSPPVCQVCLDDDTYPDSLFLTLSGISESGITALNGTHELVRIFAGRFTTCAERTMDGHGGPGSIDLSQLLNRCGACYRLDITLPSTKIWSAYVTLVRQPTWAGGTGYILALTSRIPYGTMSSYCPDNTTRGMHTGTLRGIWAGNLTTSSYPLVTNNWLCNDCDETVDLYHLDWLGNPDPSDGIFLVSVLNSLTPGDTVQDISQASGVTVSIRASCSRSEP